MNDLDYAIQRMQDAISDLASDIGDADTLAEIQGGLDDAYEALGIPNPAVA